MKCHLCGKKATLQVIIGTTVYAIRDGISNSTHRVVYMCKGCSTTHDKSGWREDVMKGDTALLDGMAPLAGERE